MGGAQRAASSGRGNNPCSRCTNGSGGNTSRGRHNRSQASKFRRSSELRQVIKLVNVDGDVSTVRRKGRMNNTSHTSVLEALLHCASKFCGARQVGNDARVCTINKTGTLDMSGLNIYKKMMHYNKK
jgi:hypothetical protein